jgi:hypothetical protein
MDILGVLHQFLFKCKVGICPIPRCALEWGVSIFSVMEGITVTIFKGGPQVHSYLAGLPHSLSNTLPLVWGAALILAGVMQALALWVPWQRPQQFAAIFAGIVWIFIGIQFARIGLPGAVAGCIWAVGAELYVAARLRP